jgi:predicted ATPase
MGMYTVHADPTGDEASILPNLELSVKNLGPVERAKISLKPLTILLGPNNCGKSHIAKLIHSIVSCETKIYTPRFLPFNPSRAVRQKVLDMAKCIDNGRMARSDVAVDLMKTYVSSFFPKVLLNNLSAATWGDVVRYGSRSCSIDIQSKIISSRIRGNTKPRTVNVTAPVICIDPTLSLPYSSDDTFQFDDKKNELRYNMPPPRTSYTRRPELMMGILANLFEYNAIKNTFRASFYIPSERAGVLDMYKSAIDGILDTTASYDGDIRSTTSEFIAQLMFLNDERGVFANAVDKIQHVMTGGRIGVSRHEMGHVSDMYYEYDGHKTSVHASSSSIKAIAPLLLLLKHSITGRDLLILEEPETDLDLKNQTRLAAFVARLVRLGLCIVVTTHSPHFVDKLSNCLRSGMLYDAGHRCSTISKDESISRDELAVYQFDKPNDTSGYTTAPVELTEYAGIHAPEFTEIDEQLYEEVLALDRQANDEISNG